MSRMQHIMAATDLSAPARHAVMRAAMLAAETGAQLALTHVVNVGMMETLRRLLGQSGETLASHLVEEAGSGLGQLAASLERRYAVKADEHVASGAVVPEIVAYAERHDADLMVLGARGTGFVRDLLIGSTTERVLKKGTRPMLVVKQMPHEPYRRILVPVDFSARSLAAIQLAHAVAPMADLILLNAFEAPFEGKLHYAGANDLELNELRAAARREAMERMNHLAGQTDIPAGKLQRLVLPGPATHCILEQEQEQDCDLIAIGKHGYGMMEEFMMGSVTKHVLALSSCDVLVADRGVAWTVARAASGG